MDGQPERARMRDAEVPARTSAGFPPETPTYGALCTHAWDGIRSPSSRWIQRGSSGASTCVSMPIAGGMGKLEWSLHPAPAGRREVEADEEDLH